MVSARVFLRLGQRRRIADRDISQRRDVHLAALAAFIEVLAVGFHARAGDRDGDDLLARKIALGDAHADRAAVAAFDHDPYGQRQVAGQAAGQVLDAAIIENEGVCVLGPRDERGHHGLGQRVLAVAEHGLDLALGKQALDGLAQ